MASTAPLLSGDNNDRKESPTNFIAAQEEGGGKEVYETIFEDAEDGGDTIAFVERRQAGTLMSLLSITLDIIAPLAVYFSLMSIPRPSFVVLGSTLAATLTVMALALRHYRYHVHKTLHIYPKVEGTCLSIVWIANAIFVCAVPTDIAQDYTVVFFINGLALANVISLAARRPLFLEAALESDPEMDNKHRRLHWRTSIAWAINIIVQAVSIDLGKVGPYSSEEYALTTQVTVPLTCLGLSLVTLPIYTYCEQRRLKRQEEQAE